jgi:hypothetical protein
MFFSILKYSILNLYVCVCVFILFNLSSLEKKDEEEALRLILSMRAWGILI